MRAISKLVGMLSCVFLLCRALFDVAQNLKAAQYELEGRPIGTATLIEQLMGVRTIQGDVVHIEEANYFVREQDGKGARLLINQKTKIRGPISPGDRIEAQVNWKNLAMTIRSLR